MCKLRASNYEPLFDCGVIVGVVVNVNSWVDGACCKEEVASTTEEETLVVTGSSLKSSYEVTKRSLNPSKVSSPLCLTGLVFLTSSPDFCECCGDPWGSSCLMTGASANLPDDPATSTVVEHFTREASEAGSFGMGSSVETGASNALGGESGTSWGCVEREACKSPYWCKNLSLNKNFILLSLAVTTLNLSKTCLWLGSLEGRGSAEKSKEWN